MANSTLPILNTSDKDLTTVQNTWSQRINPLIRNPSLQSLILPQVALTRGTNTINHRLGRKLTGWRIVRLRGDSFIYDKQDENQMPELTLILETTAAVTVDIECF